MYIAVVIAAWSVPPRAAGQDEGLLEELQAADHRRA